MPRPVTRKEFFRLGFARAATAALDVVSGVGAAVHAARSSGGPRQRSPEKTPSFVRPPGALGEPAFLAACTRCDECVKACPHWVVRKAGPELGPRIDGTPIVVPSENPCLLCDGLPCAAACPTGALRPVARPRIGLAEVDSEACYMAQGQPCDYCAVRCPAHPRGIVLKERGKPAQVVPEACTGCGVCAQICPPRAIRIQRISMAAVAILALLRALPAVAQEQAATPSFQEQAALFAAECGKCHTIGKGDRVGPDLKNVTSRREREWLVGFIQNPDEYLDSDPVAQGLLEDYQGVRMEDRGLGPEQVEGLLAYIETVSGSAAPERSQARREAKEDPYARIDLPDEGAGLEVHGLAVFFVLLAAGTGVWWWRGISPALVLFVLAGGVGYWSFGGRAHHRLPGNDQGYEPDQPIAFSHRLHAGEMEIGCLYCHSGAEKGRVAGIPAVNVCMNCHRLVKKLADATVPSTELQKILDVWESRTSDKPKSLVWTRVHRLPDFVRFDHRSHVQNGILCQECHGPVETMDRMRQASDLTMGWCVNCHRHEGKPAPGHWKRTEATLDCVACHQ